MCGTGLCDTSKQEQLTGQLGFALQYFCSVSCNVVDPDWLHLWGEQQINTDPFCSFGLPFSKPAPFQDRQIRYGARLLGGYTCRETMSPNSDDGAPGVLASNSQCYRYSGQAGKTTCGATFYSLLGFAALFHTTFFVSPPRSPTVPLACGRVAAVRGRGGFAIAKMRAEAARGIPTSNRCAVLTIAS